ncbi:helix-turn-helix domain-containing protein [Noviherbaspirillum humi]|uniref:helix-turn-helix domain-containing protein n=1 Tax=Noviherbaspirillum humi TaxID=1688639 RepID=UPI000B77AB62|nr:LysR family transcriptional regulator [Noviherbaspirillum humi]
MNRWEQLGLLALIAEQVSLSKAAEALGVSTAEASRGLNALEERLHASLVERNARRLALTESSISSRGTSSANGRGSSGPERCPIP